MPIRKRVRLKDYDYSQNGVYFITICTKNRRCLFGEITSGVMVLNDIGNLVSSHIMRLDALHADVSVNRHCIMPNHIHLLIFVCRERISCVPNDPTKSLISKLIQSFKSSVTKEFRYSILDRNASNAFPTEIWQPHFYDHIVRNEQDYVEIMKYIDTNPLRWEQDRFYITHPDKIASPYKND